MTINEGMHDKSKSKVRRRDPALQLFRIESERIKLLAPFSGQIAESLDADAPGQATF